MLPWSTSTGDLATARHLLKNNPVPGRFDGLVKNTFEPIAPELSFAYRMGLPNLWLFRPIIERELTNIPHTNAALRTTVAPTIIQGGIKEHVLPVRLCDAHLSYPSGPAPRGSGAFMGRMSASGWTITPKWCSFRSGLS
ncbi:MAG: hypothetical protein GVY15_09005 [Bacteroidetes bacterium]|jgi:hypothetical protein|nr:hypothetical protein [Bacteroidota bacterium]